MSEDNYLKIQAVIGGEETVEIVQRKRGMILEFTLSPKEGQDISQTADIKDNKLHIRLSVDSLIGLFQLLWMIVLPAPEKKRKKFLGLF